MAPSNDVLPPAGDRPYRIGPTADCAQPDGSTIFGDIGLSERARPLAARASRSRGSRPALTRTPV